MVTSAQAYWLNRKRRQKRAASEGVGVFEPGRDLYLPGDILLDYDPADLTTMFKDVNGTQPVTADGDSIALHLDKGQWGGRTLAQELARQTENLGNPSFDAGITNWHGASVSADAGTLRAVGAGAGTGVNNTDGFAITSGRTYRLAFRVKGDSAYAALQLGLRRTSALGLFVTTSAVISVTTSYVDLVYYFVATSTVADACFFIRFSGTEAVNIDSASVKEVPGYHRSQATGTSQRKYKTDGTLHWSLYDGTDDSDLTPTINWGTDKAAICTGLTKSSDAAIGVFFEFSPTANTNDGAFKALAPSSVAFATLEGSSRGTAVNAASQSAIASGLAAPITAVATTLHDIAGDLTRLRINGGTWTDAVGDKGSGNFGNYALYFGRRGGSSFPFNGREYRTVMRNRLWSASEQSSLEAFIAAKSGVTL